MTKVTTLILYKNEVGFHPQNNAKIKIRVYYNLANISLHFTTTITTHDDTRPVIHVTQNVDVSTPVS